MTVMKYIKSCGFVVYKKVNCENWYLIIKSPNGDFGFPKGHMEKEESEIQTAIRELKEETNVEVRLIDGYRYQIEYQMPNLRDVIKQAVYFLGECIHDDIICQPSEVLEAKFLTYDEALKVLTFEETKNILIDIEKKL